MPARPTGNADGQNGQSRPQFRKYRREVVGTAANAREIAIPTAVATPSAMWGEWCFGCTAARRSGSRLSRDSEKITLAAPSALASAHAKVDKAAPTLSAVAKPEHRPVPRIGRIAGARADGSPAAAGSGSHASPPSWAATAGSGLLTTKSRGRTRRTKPFPRGGRRVPPDPVHYRDAHAARLPRGDVARGSVPDCADHQQFQVAGSVRTGALGSCGTRSSRSCLTAACRSSASPT